jgi:hypothetical protein
MERCHVQWRKSSYSTETEACVELAHTAPLTVGIRDSKNPGAGRLTLPASALSQLVASYS